MCIYVYIYKDVYIYIYIYIYIYALLKFKRNFKNNKSYNPIKEEGRHDTI